MEDLTPLVWEKYAIESAILEGRNLSQKWEIPGHPATVTLYQTLMQTVLMGYTYC